ncbi:copper amine oxidase N-terminal domain-containing protein [Agathobaculum sp. Marseille-P7918]|uniref:copper amine oxidase N-terminal domain-containing protein n=1 Tax=Agathobaculum sp. Marseille-P7918 TaxID=2479843 RepID=UPI000F643E27|nr:copper amine oxidase N-terminal domain-containing protein [Agathobaculum sp. Marseille-P7918]
MKLFKRILCGTLAALTVAASVPLASAADETAKLYPLTLHVDGLRVYALNEQQQEVPTILYQGSFYLPVRTAGEWLGKNVSWDGTTQTVSLSGSVEPSFHTALPSAPSFSYSYGESISIQPRPDMTILLDSQPQTFYTASGTQIYPLLYRGTTYLPLRSVASLIGMQPAWRNATAQDAPLISLYTPMTEAQSTACLQYLAAVSEQAKAYSDAAAGLMAEKDNKTALKAQLDEMQHILEQVSAMPIPDVPYLQHSGKTITDAVAADRALLTDAAAKLQTQTAEELFLLEHGQAVGVLMQAATQSNLSTAATALLNDYQRVGLQT